MNQKHKHFDVIVAAAEGREIEWRLDEDSNWETFSSSEAFHSLAWKYGEYRIKPEPKYPETRIDDNEMQDFFDKTAHAGYLEVRHLFAAFVLRRAIQDGDVVLPEEKA